MKNFIAAGIIFITAFGGFGPCASESANQKQENRFWTFEDIELGEIPQGWSIQETNSMDTPAAWEVIETQKAPSGNQVLAISESENGPETLNLLIAEDTGFVEGDLEVRIKPLAGDYFQGGGIIFRYQDTNNYYLAVWNSLDNKLSLYVLEKGNLKELASTEVEVDPNAWHTLRVSVLGNRFKAILDEEYQVTAEDVRFAKSTKIGLWTQGDGCTVFDDLILAVPQITEDIRLMIEASLE